ncbi:MAG: hypothetical protein KDB61_10490, partial [Planctomycetes bacterium]|nr:hypothetical protein [Planctomycetota bacterium]
MRWLVALILGWLLVEGQPSAGGHWTEPHTLSFGSAYRGFGLLLMGLAACFWAGGERKPGWGFWSVLAIGSLLPNLILETPYFTLGPEIAGLGMVLLGLAWGRSKADPSDDKAAQFHGVALVLGGAGLALALQGLARILGRLSYAGADSRSLGVEVLLVLIAVGAFAFGRPLPSDSEKRARWVTPILWIGMFAILAALRAEQTLGTNRGLRSLMRRFDLDLSHAGTTLGDLLSSVSVLILPAFALGALLMALRSARQVARVLLGAAVG